MKKSIISSMALGCLALATGLVLGPKAHAAKPVTATQTGQSIMVNLLAEGTFAIVQNETYHYNKNIAATYFTNLWDGIAPTVASANGYPKTKSTTAVVPAPPPAVESPCVPTTSAPGAPLPDASKLNGPGNNDVVGDNQCNFLNGTALTGDTYQQTVDSGEQSCSYISAVDGPILHGPNTGKYNVTTTTVTVDNIYTYTYKITPNDPGTFSALTAWDFIGSTGGDTALVDINAQIAGESVISKVNLPRKYSFSLGEDITGRISRVQNLAITLNNDLTPTATPGSTVYHNAPGAVAGDPGSVDFLYTSNAGTNGHADLLYQPEPADARTILNGDDFAGNNNGGSDGEALALAIMDTVTLDLAAGDYAIHFTGVVKDNSGLSDVPISVTQTIHIVHPGCGNNP
jgi:hypothetical protein